MKISQEEYKKMYKKASPKSPIMKDCFFAFISGGFICITGQALTDTYQYAAGLPLKDARCLTSITLIFLAAVFTAFSWYDDIAKYAGAGTLVPITGFANSVVAPAIEFKSEGMIMGLGAKMFVIAGPVIVYGIVTSIIYGLVLFVFQ